MLKKTLSLIVLLLPTTVYILIFQVLFPVKYNDFKEYYTADQITITLTNEAKEHNLELVPEYIENKKNYLEIATVGGTAKLILSGNVKINGKPIKAVGDVELEVKGSGILLETPADQQVIIDDDLTFYYQDINADKTTNKISVSIGTILALLIFLLVIKAKFPTNIKITITLVALTASVFLLQSILNDMFWILLTLLVGWGGFLGISAVPSKNDLLEKKTKKAQQEFFGINV